MAPTTMAYLQQVAEARARCDAVLAARAPAEAAAVDLETTKRALADTPSAASIRAVFPRRPRVRVEAERPDANTPAPSLAEAQQLLAVGRVEVEVEDLAGRRFGDVPVLALPELFLDAGAVEAKDPAARGAVGGVAGACAAAIRLADRSLPEPYVVSLARACTQVAVFSARYLREPETRAPLPACRREAWTFKQRRRDACVVRIGVHTWSPSYRGLGVEVATSSAVAVAGAGEAGDQTTLKCAGRLWCPLAPEVIGDDLDELDTLPLITKCWYEFWTDAAKGIVETASMAPSTRLKRSTALGAQTVGWGENPMRCLGRDLGAVAARPLPLFARDVGALERIRSVACSARHTVALTWRGRVFCCGDNEDGACGVGGTQKVTGLASCSWPDDAPVTCSRIAAGADVFGAASCAVSTEGVLYCWGSGVACASRATAPRLVPTLVEFPEAVKISTISAGGSFCVALDTDQRLWSWGMYASGRLGLGVAPLVRDPRIREGDTARPGRSARLQLAPKLISRVAAYRGPQIAYYGTQDDSTTESPAWASITCGEAHALAIDQAGRLYAFGSNAHGQLGLGGAPEGGTQDAWVPTPVNPFFMRRVVSAGCGPTHSAVVDGDGQAWTWGGGGHGLALLGHGARSKNAPPLMSTTDWMARRVVDRRRPAQKGVRGALRATRTLTELRFAWPRRVAGLDGLSIAQIACGERHTAFLAQDGSLYCCGDGLALLGADETKDRARKVDSFADEEALLQAAVEASVVDVPRQPNACWLPALSGMRVERIACGGQHTVALVSGPQSAHLLGAKLWKDARRATKQLNGEEASDDEEEDALVDCLLVPGGGDPIYAHLAVLACRSPLLEELILMEKREDGQDDGYLQILVPDLSPRVCELFLEYCYRDDIFEPRDPLPLPLIAELSKAAETYQVERLAALCQQALGASSIDESYKDVPPSTLAEDFEALVGSKGFADVTISAAGGSIRAHRLFLAARSQYFRAMFRSGMRESREADGFERARPKVEVSVPDDDDDLNRLFRAVYSSKLPLGDGERFLRDVVAADRYGLTDVRRLGESGCATADSADHALVLGTAHRLQAANLYRDVSGKACADIGLLTKQEDFAALPLDVLEDLVKTIAAQRPHLLRPAPPPEPPYDPDKIISTPAAAGNLSWRHSLAMTLAALCTFVAQSQFRFRQTASMVINGLFLLFTLWLFRDSARREAAARKKTG